MARILVADSDPGRARQVRACLLRRGHQTDLVRTGPAALARAGQSRPDLVILAADLSGLDGVEVTQRLRSAGQWLPLILVAPRADVAERILGLEAGADDYLAGASPRELAARVHAVLRRSRAAAGPPPLRVGQLCVEPSHFVASTRGRPLDLHPQEFRLLRVLASQPGRVFSREQLIHLAWQHTVMPGTVDAHMCRLRRKLADAKVRIETVRGRGYRLVT